MTYKDKTAITAMSEILARRREEGNKILLTIKQKENMTNENEFPGIDVEATSIIKDKEWRVQLDIVLQEIKANGLRRSRERSLATTKLEEAIMWLGMDLKAIGAPNPYPNSYKPENTIVDPTADGLKM